MPTRLKVQSVTKAVSSELSVRHKSRHIHAKLCFYYSRYSLAEARRLPYRDIALLLKVAQQEQAGFLHSLTQVVAAPHTKKGQGVKKLAEHFKKIMRSE